MTTIRTKQTNLIITPLRYKFEGAPIDKDDMYQIVKFVFSTCPSVDIEKDWASIHDDTHPIDDRLLIILFINDLLRDNDIPAMIIGEVINTGILTERK